METATAAVLRGRIGASVRLYGYPGRYRIEDAGRHGYSWVVRPEFGTVGPFAVCDSSLIEVDGAPVALLSWPLGPPADDFPADRYPIELRPQEGSGYLRLREWVEARPEWFRLILD